MSFLAAAQQICDATPGTVLGAELGRLIGMARGAASDDARLEAIDLIRELLIRDEAARRRLDELLAPGEGTYRGFEGLAGDAEASADSFDAMVCPRGDYAWPILDVSDPAKPPATCPNDGSPLTFQAAGS